MTHAEPAKTDLRVQRTQKLIVEALIAEATEKGFAAVSVHDITRRAGINRATFYRHYQDKFNLLDRYTETVYELLDAPVPAGPAGSEKSAQGLARMFDHIRAHAAFYRVMLGQHGDPGFAAKIRQYVEKRMRRSLPPALLKDANAAGLYLACISSSSLGAVLWWLEHDLPYTSEEMAALSFRLGAANVEAMLRQAAPAGAPH